MSKRIVTIDSSEYKDLQQTYSERNIINVISGNEVAVTASTNTLTDIDTQDPQNPKQIAIARSTYISDSNSEFMYGWDNSVAPIRWEEIYYFGTYSFTTDSVVLNPSDISIDIELLYEHKEISTNLINSTNCRSGSSVFIGLAYYNPIEPISTKQDNLTTIPIPIARANSKILNGPNLQIIDKQITIDNNGKINIRIDYRVLIWSAYNIKTNSGTDKNYTNLVDSFNISVNGNVVETKTIPFKYSSAANNYNTYNLSDNELIQTVKGESMQDKMSYKLSQEIFDNFGINKPLVSFDLLSPKKYDFNGEQRYIQSEDFIRIKDSNGKLINAIDIETGEEYPAMFQIIKVENVWDGSFHKLITCNEITKQDLTAYATPKSGVTYTAISDFSDYTDEQINRISKAISNCADITSSTQTVYFSDATSISIGATRSYTLSTQEQMTDRILGFNHDKLANNIAYGEETATQKAGITWQMVNCLGTRYEMNDTDTNSGDWKLSKMRTTTLPAIKATMPSTIQSIIKTVAKNSSAGAESYDNDDLFLLSEIEVYGSATYAKNGNYEGSQYAYWTTHTGYDRIKYYDNNGTQTSTRWWQRSSSNNDNAQFCNVNAVGVTNVSNANVSLGVSFAYCT